jgi:hypothetical protein
VAILPPETLLLAALPGLAGIETFFIPFRLLNAPDQVTLLHFTRFDAPLGCYRPYPFNFHASTLRDGPVDESQPLQLPWISGAKMPYRFRIQGETFPLAATCNSLSDFVQSATSGVVCRSSDPPVLRDLRYNLFPGP